MPANETTQSPALNSSITVKGRAYKVVACEAQGPNVVSARGGRQGFHLGLEGARGTVYMAGWDSETGSVYGRLVSV